MRKIPTFENYAISRDGRKIFNITSGKIVKQSYKDGYAYVTIRTSDYVYKRVGVHRLVAFAYLPAPHPGRIWIKHKNGIKSDNKADNLEWISVSENIRTSERKYRKRQDHHRYGKRHTLVTRAIMSEKKTGENHPRFIGWYTYNGKRYASLRAASAATGYDRRKISKFSRCEVYGWSLVAP